MKLFRSFKFAFTGVKHGLEEYNMRVHLVITIIVLLMGILFSITLLEWVALVLAIGLVLTAELFNTAIEEVCDVLTDAHPNSHKKAGKPKDISAGAVLLASVVASTVGLIIFLPHLLSLLS